MTYILPVTASTDIRAYVRVRSEGSVDGHALGGHFYHGGVGLALDPAKLALVDVSRLVALGGLARTVASPNAQGEAD